MSYIGNGNEDRLDDRLVKVNVHHIVRIEVSGKEGFMC